MTLTPVEECNVCGEGVGELAIDLAPPALTSMNSALDLPTQVFICRGCGHLQSPTLPDLKSFYDTGYRISLDSEDHDQLYGTEHGQPVYRTDKQAAVILDLFPLKPNAKVLDYGAAKGATLRKIVAKRPDLQPHIFDISEDYREFWASWLPPTSCGTYDLDPAWLHRFDLITANYVLEHVPDAAASLANLKSFLSPEGAIFFSVPDWESNPGDLLVADHVNHFTETSIRRAVRKAGLKVFCVDRDRLPSAFTVVCIPDDVEPMPPAADVKRTADNAALCAAGLTRACARLDQAFADNMGRKSAIFGGGFYGLFLFTRARRKISISCFLDNNPHLWPVPMFGLPVMPPKELPIDVEVVYVGLNPNRARDIVNTVPALAREGLDLVFFDTGR